MGGGGSERVITQTQQGAQVPPELRPLFGQTSALAGQFQRAASLDPFAQERVFPVSPLAPLQQAAIGNVPFLGQAPVPEQLGILGQAGFLGGPTETSPAVQAAVQGLESQIFPRVQNQLALAGLGRSGALGQELQQQAFGSLLPVFQQGLQQQQVAAQNLANIGNIQAQRGFQQQQAALRAGELQRSPEQQAIEEQRADFLRRQALAEKGLFAPLGGFIPSTIGQTSTSQQQGGGGGGGFFK